MNIETRLAKAARSRVELRSEITIRKRIEGTEQGNIRYSDGIVF